MSDYEVDLYMERICIGLQITIIESEFEKYKARLKEIEEELYWIRFINYCHTGR